MPLRAASEPLDVHHRRDLPVLRAEMRHPPSKRSTAAEALFTSGIKSAYDIETSGWMRLSQGTGTTCALTVELK